MSGTERDQHDPRLGTPTQTTSATEEPENVATLTAGADEALVAREGRIAADGEVAGEAPNGALAVGETLAADHAAAAASNEAPSAGEAKLAKEATVAEKEATVAEEARVALNSGPPADSAVLEGLPLHDPGSSPPSLAELVASSSSGALGSTSGDLGSGASGSTSDLDRVKSPLVGEPASALGDALPGAPDTETLGAAPVRSKPPPAPSSTGIAPGDEFPTPATRLRTDAPVARTKPPPAPARKPSSNLGSIALFVLGAGAVFFGIRAVQTKNESPAETRLEEGSADSDADSSESAADLTETDLQHPALSPVDVKVDVAAKPAEPDRAPATQPRVRASATPKPEAVNTVAAALSKDVAPAPTEQATETETEAEPVDVQFNANAAALALDAAASRAATCRKPGDPSGMATVTITFAPGGRVTTATISGPPFAGTETGGCIASIMRAARVPPFAGNFLTIKKTVAIQ